MAITHYEIIEERQNISLVKCILETGRTHQIRVHLSYIGHPIIGDTLYNSTPPSSLIQRQALHSNKVKFTHPITKKVVTYKSSLPEDMQNIIQI